MTAPFFRRVPKQPPADTFFFWFVAYVLFAICTSAAVVFENEIAHTVLVVVGTLAAFTALVLAARALRAKEFDFGFPITFGGVVALLAVLYEGIVPVTLYRVVLATGFVILFAEVGVWLVRSVLGDRERRRRFAAREQERIVE